MRRTSLAPHRKRKGVSEVLGALLLIVVVVAAVASLSVFLSQAQTNAEAREALLTSVKNENLQISNVQFALGTNSTQVWNTTTISIRNLNTAQSGLYQIQVNGIWLTHWQEVGLSYRALSPVVIGKSDAIAIVIPARATLNFNLSVYHINITRNDSVKITLMSAAGNFFTTEYLPPTAIVTSNTMAENYQAVTRDIVSFDGSQSYSVNSSIQGYSWKISIPQPIGGVCKDSTFSSPRNVDSQTISGETIQYLPESLFNATVITNDCITGPIEAALTVTDTDGLQSTSQPVIVSPDPSIAPAATVSLYSGPTYANGTSGESASITIKVNNIFGTPVLDVPVTTTIASGSGNITLTSPSYVTTGTTGATFTFNCIGDGTTQFESGTLAPVLVPINCP